MYADTGVYLRECKELLKSIPEPGRHGYNLKAASDDWVASSTKSPRSCSQTNLPNLQIPPFDTAIATVCGEYPANT